MKTISTTRIDDSITVYKNHIIIPRKVATTYSEENGASETEICYTASILDDENPNDGLHRSMECFKTLEGTLKIAKLEIDLYIAKFGEYI